MLFGICIMNQPHHSQPSLGNWSLLFCIAPTEWLIYRNNCTHYSHMEWSHKNYLNFVNLAVWHLTFTYWHARFIGFIGFLWSIDITEELIPYNKPTTSYLTINNASLSQQEIIQSQLMPMMAGLCKNFNTYLQWERKETPVSKYKSKCNDQMLLFILYIIQLNAVMASAQRPFQLLRL